MGMTQDVEISLWNSGVPAHPPQIVRYVPWDPILFGVVISGKDIDGSLPGSSLHIQQVEC